MSPTSRRSFYQWQCAKIQGDLAVGTGGDSLLIKLDRKLKLLLAPSQYYTVSRITSS